MKRIDFILLKQSIKNNNYSICNQEIINLDGREFSIHEKILDEDSNEKCVYIWIYDFNTNKLCLTMTKKINDKLFMIDELYDDWWNEKMEMYGLLDAMIAKNN